MTLSEKTEAKPLLSQNEARVLKTLCECQPGKGMLLYKPDTRIARRLVGGGLAWSLNGGFGDIFIATDKGRIANGEAIATCKQDLQVQASGQAKLDSSVEA